MAERAVLLLDGDDHVEIKKRFHTFLEVSFPVVKHFKRQIESATSMLKEIQQMFMLMSKLNLQALALPQNLNN